MSVRRACAAASVVLVCLVLPGCGEDSATQTFRDEVESKLCVFEGTARSIGRDAAAFVERQGDSVLLDPMGQRDLLALIARMESYYRKVARQMRTIKAPPKHEPHWKQLAAVYERIHADARHARYEGNAGRRDAGVRFLSRYDRHSARAVELRQALDVPMDCRD